MAEAGFRCRGCGTFYTKQKKAEYCEKSHLPPVGFSGQTYKHKTEGNHKYPTVILVKFPNGKEIKYQKEFHLFDHKEPWI